MGLSLCSFDEATTVVLSKTQGSKGLLGAGKGERGATYLPGAQPSLPSYGQSSPRKNSRGCRERDDLVGQERNGEEREIRNRLGDDAERATLRI